MAGLNFEAVSEKLQELLETVDLDATTTKDIFQMLTESLGNGVKRFKKEIRASIGTYFASKESQNEDEPSPEADVDNSIQLTPQVSVGIYPESKPPHIEICDRGEEETSESVNRIKMSFDEFSELLEETKEPVNKKDPARKRGYSKELGSEKRIKIQTNAEDESDISTTCKKGEDTAKMTVRLDAIAKKALQQQKGTLIEKMRSVPPSATPPVAAGKKRRLDVNSHETDVPSTNKSKKLASADHVLSLELDNNIFLNVSQFKGHMRADLRRYYIDKQTDERRPTQKGLSMDKEQFKQLIGKLQELKQAVAEKNAEFFFELGHNRRASVSDFTGRLLIDLREYYQPKSGGELKPGKKGISFDPRVLDVLSEKGETILDTLD